MMILLGEKNWSELIWSSTVAYGNAALAKLPTLLMALGALIVFVLLASIARALARRSAQRLVHDESLENLFGTLAHIGVLVIGVFCAAGVLFPGLSAGHLVSVLGLSSVAIGFAFKEIFENFLAGVLILAQRPFRIGDQIIVSGFEGTIEDISIRSTSIKTYDSERIIIPNSELYNSPVQVRTAYDERRSKFATGIGYAEDIEAGREAIAEALASCETILEDPAPTVIVNGHGDSSVHFEVRFWTESRAGDVVAGRDEVATKVKYALDESDIEIPYPYRTVEFHDMSDDEERDAA
jgi:small-conductance mechanosensitive channel